ncbi:MAG: ABC transporter permease [Bacteroidota bacterium]
MNIFRFVFEGIRMAFGAVLANKTRAFLTMLGVATGIFAITSILTMVSSMKSSIKDNLSELGNTTLIVSHWPWTDTGKSWRELINRPKVSYREFQKLRQNLDNVIGVSYYAGSRVSSVSAKGQSVKNVEVQGITTDHSAIFNFNFEYGRFFTDLEFRYGSNVCVVGYGIAESLFPNQPPEGKYIRIGGKKLKIIGVLEKVGNSMFGDQDNQIYVPYKVTPRIFNLNKRWIDKTVAIKVTEADYIPAIESETIGIIRAARGLRPKDENNFEVNKLEMILQEVDKIMSYLSNGGWIISAFSILIGGFSIGMIMYISVRERTKEIGIQKALGSTRSFILHQFLTESIIICLLGGFIGLLGVFGTAAIVQYLVEQAEMPLKIAVSAGNVGTAVGLSTLIGLVSGIIPAWMASTIDPVIAIRQG